MMASCTKFLTGQNYDSWFFVVAATKEELMKLNGMPNEDYKIHQGYEPNEIKVRPVLYDA